MGNDAFIDLNGVRTIRDWVKATFLLKEDAEKMMASKIKITFGSNFAGQTYTITGGANESYTGTVPDTLMVEQIIKELDTTYNITCVDDGGMTFERTVTVGNYYGVYSCEPFFSSSAYLSITCDPNATVKAVGSKTYTATAGANGTCTIEVDMVETYALTATLNGKTTKPVSVTVEAMGETIAVTLPPVSLEIVSWSEGTDEQIAAMVAALDAGTISIEDTGWAIGDERTVSLSAMAGVNRSETHIAQSVTLVLGNMGGKFFEDGTECHFVVLQKDCLKERGIMNSSGTSQRPTNSGGWEKCPRRTWCNNVYSAAFPTTLLPIFKKFKNISGVGGGASSGTQETVDLFALAGEGEIFGSRYRAFADEVSAETQFDWYKTSANRIKKLDGSAYGWWERSPRSGDDSTFCTVRAGGDGLYDYTASYLGIAPFGCI